MSRRRPLITAILGRVARAILAAAAIAAAAGAAGGCGDRAGGWSAPAGQPQAIGLAHSVALLDLPAQRIVALAAAPHGALAPRRTPTRRNVVAAASSPRGDKLYLLSAGHRAALGDPIPDEEPLLTAFDDGPALPVEIKLGLTDPLDGLAIDPSGSWAVIYAAGKDGSALVTNPNELVIVDLAAGTARHHTIHSFGGRPERIVITRALALPGGPAPLLIVQAPQQLALLPLAPGGAGELAEITVRLAGPTAVNPPPPADIVFDDGDPDDSGDTRIGIRFQGDRNLMMLQLVASSDGGAGFLPSVNVADAGGVPSDIAFVRTDGGMRLAALVPATSQAVLIDPVTTATTLFALPAAYQRLSLVTDGAGAPGGADVALLWQGSAAAGAGGVAFWELGQAAGRPFRSIETVAIADPVTDVLAVPLAGAAVKILAGTQAFYVLDLAARTAAPLVTSTALKQVRLTVSPTGARVWAFRPGATDLAVTDVGSKQVRSLRADSSIDAVFEVGQDTGDGRSLIALHQVGAIGATVYDVDAPDDTGRKIYGGLLVEGPYAN
jgi:hypothetical protein